MRNEPPGEAATALTIDFTITGYGWMTCSFAVAGGQPFSVGASYVSDVVGDFLALAAAVATGEVRADCLVMRREPEGSVLTCLVKDDGAHVTITSSDDTGDLSFRVERACLVRAIVDGVSRIDRDEYREQWALMEFPEEKLRRLEELIALLGRP